MHYIDFKTHYGTYNGSTGELVIHIYTVSIDIHIMIYIVWAITIYKYSENECRTIRLRRIHGWLLR